MKRWMIFYREKDRIYYLYNGHWPICIDPKPVLVNMWSTIDDSRDDISDPVGKDVLDTANGTPRNRTFIIDKQRYIITARGTFEED